MSPAVSSNSYADGTALYAADTLPTPPGSNTQDSQTEETPQFNDVLKSQVAANTPQSPASASTTTSTSTSPAPKAAHAKSVAKTLAADLAKQAQTSAPTADQKAVTVPTKSQIKTYSDPQDDTEEANTETESESGADVEKESEQPQLSANLQQSYKSLVSSQFSYSSLVTSQSVLPKTAQKGADQPSVLTKDKKSSDSSSAQSTSSSSTTSSSFLEPFGLSLNLPVAQSALTPKDDAKDSATPSLSGFDEKSESDLSNSLTGFTGKTEGLTSLVPKANPGLGTPASKQGAIQTSLSIPSANSLSYDPNSDPTTTLEQTNTSFNLQRQIQAASLPTSSSTPATQSTQSTAASSFVGSNWSTMQLSLQLKKSSAQPSTDTKSSSVEKMSPTTPTQGTIFHQNLDAFSNQATNANVSNNQNQFISQQPHLQVTDLQSVTNALATSQKSTSPDRAISAVTLGTNHAIEKAVANTNSSLIENWTGTTNLAATSPMNTTSHKVLNSNSEFTGVLRQVVQQVQSDPSVSVLSPRRVSIEIQTPPGAVVNVYISRQNDQYRAQLSTSDPQALKWVQDQVSALQQSPDMGSDVRWLPAQLESQQRDEAWRGGNNQEQPTPDERNGKKTPESQDPEDDFMNITNKIKGAV